MHVVPNWYSARRGQRRGAYPILRSVQLGV